MNSINKNSRKVVYPIINSFYQVENGCKMGNPPTEEIKIEIKVKESVKETSFLDDILKLFKEEN